jgi:hypothetical protein
VNWEHAELQRVKGRYGKAVAELLMDKRTEIELYNPSGELNAR